MSFFSNISHIVGQRWVFLRPWLPALTADETLVPSFLNENSKEVLFFPAALLFKALLC